MIRKWRKERDERSFALVRGLEKFGLVLEISITRPRLSPRLALALSQVLCGEQGLGARHVRQTPFRAIAARPARLLGAAAGTGDVRAMASVCAMRAGVGGDATIILGRDCVIGLALPLRPAMACGCCSIFLSR